MFRTLLTLLLTLALTACGPADTPDTKTAAPDPASPDTLVLAAGSEVKDMVPLIERLRAETGVNLVLKYIGTLDGIERISAGERYDGAWFSHAKYLMLIPEAASKVKASEKIMLSPVVLGVKESKAQQFGWGAATSWAAIAEKADKGAFRFAMTNPASSNSGFSALVGVAASFAGKSDALEVADIDKRRMAKLFKGQALTSGSSGWLAERYMEEQDSLDGIVNYESVLLSLNRSGKLREKLALVYPQDGVLTADYPLILFNDAKRAAYDKAVAWLKGSQAQSWLMTNTLRRPANPAVAADKALFGDALLVDMAFPGKLAVVDALLTSYLGEQRPPAGMYFVLDVSGSMAGKRINDLQRALRVLAGKEERSLSATFTRFQSREQITLIPFAESVRADEILTTTIEPDNPAAALNRIAAFSDNLRADGGTAMYDGLLTAYGRAADDMKSHPERYYTVVVMTDGQNNNGATSRDFHEWLAKQSPALRKVKTFTVLFGEGNEQELMAVADATGGKFFDSRKTTLAAIFKEIRGYQ